MSAAMWPCDDVTIQSITVITIINVGLQTGLVLTQIVMVLNRYILSSTVTVRRKPSCDLKRHAQSMTHFGTSTDGILRRFSRCLRRKVSVME